MSWARPATSPGPGRLRATYWSRPTPRKSAGRRLDDAVAAGGGRQQLLRALVFRAIAGSGDAHPSGRMELDMALAGRVAFVTGGGRGIGRATALALARAGADVAVSARTAAEIGAVAAEVRGLGRRRWP